MGKHADFVVHLKKGDTQQDITYAILNSLFIQRSKNNKPTVTFVGGGSGEGKSWGVLKILEALLAIQGLNVMDCMNLINIFTPLEYSKKLNVLLFDKKYKKVNVFALHESRDIVNSKDWRQFVTRGIADVNTQMRRIKPMMTFIISQFIRDITLDVRYTLNYYIIVRRPRGKPARAYISVMWKDDRDLEHPRLRKRRIKGYLVDEKGRYREYRPKYLELARPSKEITDLFEKADYDAKSSIIKRKLDDIIKRIQQDIGDYGSKIDVMVEHYSTNTETLSLIGKRRKDKLKVHKDFKEMHDLTDQETVIFENKLHDALLKKGVVGEREEAEVAP